MISPTSTRSVRTNLYHPDGHGRDTYIFGNNGGFYKCANKFNQNYSASHQLNPTNKKVKLRSW
jgi:hypothetical protein